jgi:hypothetical protein
MNADAIMIEPEGPQRPHPIPALAQRARRRLPDRLRGGLVMASLDTPSATAQQPATVAQHLEKGLLQTPPCNSAATVDPATGATAVQHRCNKAQQHRNSVKISQRNSATSPYRGGETVAPPRAHPNSPAPRHQRSACGDALPTHRWPPCRPIRPELHARAVLLVPTLEVRKARAHARTHARQERRFVLLGPISRRYSLRPQSLHARLADQQSVSLLADSSICIVLTQLFAIAWLIIRHWECHGKIAGETFAREIPSIIGAWPKDRGMGAGTPLSQPRSIIDGPSKHTTAISNLSVSFRVAACWC